MQTNPDKEQTGENKKLQKDTDSLSTLCRHLGGWFRATLNHDRIGQGACPAQQPTNFALKKSKILSLLEGLQ